MVHRLTTKDLNERLREGLSDTFLKHDYWKDQAERDRVQELIYRLEDRQADA